MTLPIGGFVTFLYVPSLAATARFYEEVLELELALDQGSCRIYRVTDSAFVGFCEKEDATKPRGVILTFVTADVDGFCGKLKAKGVRFEKEPRHNPRFRIYHAFFRDPDGHLIEVQRFEDPAWTGP